MAIRRGCDDHLGALPKIAGRIVAEHPDPGARAARAIAMFATVAVRHQTLSRVDCHDHRNVVIVATRSSGLAMTRPPCRRSKAVPVVRQIIFGSGITLGSITAIVLNLVFHHISGGAAAPAVAVGIARRQPGAPRPDVQRVSTSTEEFTCAPFSGLFQARTGGRERARRPRPFKKHTQDLRRFLQEALHSGQPGGGAGAAHQAPP